MHNTTQHHTTPGNRRRPDHRSLRQFLDTSEQTYPSFITSSFVTSAGAGPCSRIFPHLSLCTQVHPYLLAAGCVRCLVNEKHHRKAHPNAEILPRFCFLVSNILRHLILINCESSICFRLVGTAPRSSILRYYDGSQCF